MFMTNLLLSYGFVRFVQIVVALFFCINIEAPFFVKHMKLYDDGKRSRPMQLSLPATEYQQTERLSQYTVRIRQYRIAINM